MFTRSARLLILLSPILLLAACSRSAPTSPELSTAAAPAASEGGAVTWTPFDLIEGTSTVLARDGTLTGTYSGQAFVSPIGQTAAITVTVTGGTGDFANATGTLRGTGTGAFTGEGGFAIVLQGPLTIAGATRNVRLALRGDATIGCSFQLIAVTQTGQGTAVGQGRITGTLQHQVTNTSCSG